MTRVSKSNHIQINNQNGDDQKGNIRRRRTTRNNTNEPKKKKKNNDQPNMDRTIMTHKTHKTSNQEDCYS